MRHNKRRYRKWDLQIPKIKKLLKVHKSIQSIANHYCVSRQAIWNICNRHGIDTTKYMKHRNKCKKNTLRNKINRNRKYLHSFGISYDEMKKISSDRFSNAILRKFKMLRGILKARGSRITLKFSDLKYPTHCPILGIKLNYFNTSRKDNSVSIDRINNNKGYVKNNIQILSWRANRLKSDGTINEHIKIAKFLNDKESVT